MTALTLDITCPECGEVHPVDLDRQGRFDCPLPCDPQSGKRLKGATKREAWLALQAALATRKVH